MPYVPPDVRVEIQYDGFASPDPNVSMPPMYLGPCFQKVSRGVGGSYVYDNGLTILAYPDLESGAIVNTESVVLTLVHSGTGDEYDVTDGLGVANVVITLTDITMSRYIYDLLLGSATGAREDDYEISDPGRDFAGEGIIYEDILHLTEYATANEWDINEVDSTTGNLVLINNGTPLPEPELKVSFTEEIPDPATGFFAVAEHVTSDNADPGDGIIEAVVYDNVATYFVSYNTEAGGDLAVGDSISWTDGVPGTPSYGEGVIAHRLSTGAATGYIWITNVIGDAVKLADVISDITTPAVSAAAAAAGIVMAGRGWSGHLLLNTVTGTFADGDTLEGGTSAAEAAEVGDGVVDPYLEYEIRRPMNGTVYVTYDAARAAYNDQLVWIGSMSDLITYAGTDSQIVPTNPLVYASKLGLSIGSGSYLMNVQDIDGYLDPDNADLDAWLDAFEIIRWHDHAYAHVLLCQSDDVRSAFETFMNWKRDPDNYLNEIIGMYSMPRRLRDDAIPLRRIGGGGVSENGATFTDTSIDDFTVYGCLPGRYLELVDADGNAYAYRVSTVVGDTITFATNVAIEHRLLTSYRYVNEYYTADREANYYKLYGQSVQNCNMRICAPDLCIVEDETVPSYCLYAIRAAQLSVDRPATIYTKANIPYVTRVLGRSFTPPQLNTIAEGGIEIFTQKLPTLPVYSRDAITTDPTHPARMEQVVQTEIDYSARYIRAKFRPDQGKHFMDEWMEAGIAILAGGCDRHLVSETRTLAKLVMQGWAVDSDDPRYLDLDFELFPRWPNRSTRIVLHVRTRSV